MSESLLHQVMCREGKRLCLFVKRKPRSALISEVPIKIVRNIKAEKLAFCEEGACESLAVAGNRIISRRLAFAARAPSYCQSVCWKYLKTPAQ